MKKFLLSVLVMAAIAFPTIAQESKGSSSSQHVELEFRQYKNPHTILRAPMRINIEAYYDAESQSINICYDGEAEGEVFLYLNGNLVGYDSEINTSFSISDPGLYKLEIVGQTWAAQGYIQL